MLIAGVGKRTESMREHLETMWKYASLLFIENGYHVFLAKKLKLKTSEAIETLKYTIAFHDLGKLFFQEELRKRGVAPFHEIYSVASLDFSKMNINYKLRRSILTAILLHHHAMRSLLKILKTNYACRSTLKEHVEEFMGLVREVLGISVPLKNGVVYGETVCVDVSEIKSLIVGENYLRNYVDSLLLLYPLVVVDNVAAYVNREGGRAEEVRAVFARIAYKVEIESKRVAEEVKRKILGL